MLLPSIEKQLYMLGVIDKYIIAYSKRITESGRLMFMVRRKRAIHISLLITTGRVARWTGNGYKLRLR